MGKKKKQDEVKKGLDEWMGTYSDMITLLFCFFVLLYAQSTRDEVKMQYIFQSFSSSGTFINPVVMEEKPNSSEADTGDSNTPPINKGGGDGSVTQIGAGTDDAFESLYNWVSLAMEDSEASDSISVSASKNQIRICLDNDVLFDPDSATLKDAGRNVLRLFTPAIKATQDYIASIQISGHTADIKTASTVNDWDLSALRASSVLKYLDYARVIDSKKLQLEAYAQYRPIADNDSDEGRAKNRRVEIIINRADTGTNAEVLLEDILKYDYNSDLVQVDSDGNPLIPKGPTNEDIINSVVKDIEDRYSGYNGESGEGSGEVVGPAIGDDLTIPDSDYIAETDAESSAAPISDTEE